MKMAQDRARIEERKETAEREELEELDARKRKVFEMEDQKEEEEEGNVRESVVSGETEFSEATKEEMNEINRWDCPKYSTISQYRSQYAFRCRETSGGNKKTRGARRSRDEDVDEK